MAGRYVDKHSDDNLLPNRKPHLERMNREGGKVTPTVFRKVLKRYNETTKVRGGDWGKGQRAYLETHENAINHSIGSI